MIPTLPSHRILCYVFLAHTLYAYTSDLAAMGRPLPFQGVGDLCDLAGEDLSFTRNLEYWVIDRANCSYLSADSEFFQIYEEAAVTDAAGLRTERLLLWVDVIEAVAWLLILLTIELMVRWQHRKIIAGPLIVAGNTAKVVLYASLLGAASYWAYKQQWFFVWDEFVWIGGFAAIEMNVSEWRQELSEADRGHVVQVR